jgi:hypothetical protein
MCWPVMRLVNEGHDYGLILKGWTLPMVLRANKALDVQEKANTLSARKARSQSGSGSGS